MTEYNFLSKDWIAAAEELRSEYQSQLETSPVAIKLNVNITDLPDDIDHPDVETLDGKPAVKGHVDSAKGHVLIEQGHVDDPEITITTDYKTALAAFVTQDQQELMTAFMGGKILVDGDVSKLLALQAPPSDPEAAALANEVYDRLRAFTKV